MYMNRYIRVFVANGGTKELLNEELDTFLETHRIVAEQLLDIKFAVSAYVDIDGGSHNNYAALVTYFEL